MAVPCLTAALLAVGDVRWPVELTGVGTQSGGTIAGTMASPFATGARP